MTHETRFQNLYPKPERKGSLVDMLRYVLVERQRSGAKGQINPFKPTPVVANDGEALRDNTSRATITWIGHSSFLIQMGGRSLLTDPVWSKTSGAGPFGSSRIVAPGVRLVDLPPIDLVLISHNHYDHLDYDTIRRLGNR